MHGFGLVLSVLKRRAKAGAAAFVVTTAAGLSLLWVLPKQYHATFEIEVLQSEPGANEIERVKNMLGVAKGAGEVDEFSTLVRSHAVVDSALEMSGVVDRDTPPGLRDYYVYKLRNDITVQREGSSNVVRIFVPASDAALAHALARGLMHSLESHEKESRIHRLRESRDNLEKLLRGVENRIREMRLMRDAYAKVAEQERKIAETQAKIRTIRDETQREILVLKRQRESLLEQYTADWHEVRDIDEKLAFLTSFDDPKAKAPVSSPVVVPYRDKRDTYLVLLDEEAKFLEDFDEMILSVWKRYAVHDSVAAVDEELKRLLENAEAVRRDITRYATAMESSPARHRVTKQPVRPEYPSSPDKQKVILLSILAALAIAGLVVYSLEGFDASLRTPEAVQHFAKVESLGTIPHMNGSIRKRADHPIAFGTEGELSPYIESFRALKTNVLYAIPQVVSPVVLVTSTDREEGKSTVASNLALAFAEDRRVLVIAANLRRPTMHAILDAPDDAGLVQVLEGDLPWTQAVRPTKYRNLSVITHGRIAPNSSVLLGRPAFAKMLAEAREQYDLVLIDSPPMLLIVDAAIVAPKADATVLVYSLGETEKESLARALAILKRVKASYVGIASNQKHQEVMERRRKRYYQQEEEKK
ncbi:MAG: polysaccharide biosynthesis tyrosine autokinase [Planctomycetes bacterium]|nr:polysaccharide biosynthesis tyrosine autokinase [Planctomycetota bacterium]